MTVSVELPPCVIVDGEAVMVAVGNVMGATAVTEKAIFALEVEPAETIETSPSTIPVKAKLSPTF